jgi:hypothetical protein
VIEEREEPPDAGGGVKAPPQLTSKRRVRTTGTNTRDFNFIFIVHPRRLFVLFLLI